MSTNNRTILALLCVILLGALVCIIVLAVLYAEKAKETKDDQTTSTEQADAFSDMDVSQCDDVAIVGAGVAGSYAAWRLRDRGMNITVYEYSNRIGGRCHTIKFPGIPDVNLELGAMRFKPLQHRRINKTVHELGLTVQDFLVGYGYHPDSLLYIRGHHMRYKDLENSSVPYNLEEKHKGIDFDRLNWKVFADNTDINPDLEGFMDDPEHIRTKDGVELWKQSRQGFYFKYVNVDTAKYLQDVGFWDADYGDVSAAQFIPYSEPEDTAGAPEPVKTVASGFQSISEAMIQQFLDASDKHKLKKNYHLRSIVKQGGIYMLTFQPTETVDGITKDIEEGSHLSSKPIHVCAKKVLLGVGRLSLENIDWKGFKDQEVQDYIRNSVFDAHAGKMYFASASKWWAELDETPHLTVSDTPLRQTFHFGDSVASGQFVLCAGYMDSNTYIRFWRELQQQGVAYPGTTDRTATVTTYTVNNARKLLAAIYNVTVEQIPLPEYAAMGVWDSYPYGASWYSRKPGYDFDKVMAKMLRPSASDDVYVLSNAFSGSLSGWVEGALERVEEVLKYFQQ